MAKQQRKTHYHPAFQKDNGAAKQPVALSLLNNKHDALMMLFLAMITLLVYRGVMYCGFTNWDDPNYITENKTITALSRVNIKTFFTKGFMGNYHPFTMLVYALEYKFFGLKASAFHFTNVIFHAANAILVYRLSRVLKFGIESSVIVASIFALHPMHVESVAWVSELKDVLYAFFFIASLICYVKYCSDNGNLPWNNPYYIYSIVFFICSLLCKGQAVALSLILLSIDYYFKRGWSSKVLIEKLPFFVLSIVFGVIAIIAQHSFGATSGLQVYSIGTRLLFASYGLLLYIVKFIVPFGLSSYIPFPPDNAAIIYIMPFVLITLVFLSYKLARRNTVFVFGISFFLFTILMLLQILPVGATFIAERYSYIPYIGLSFIVGHCYDIYFLKHASRKILGYLLCSGVLIFCGISTFKRIGVWQNSMTLWTDALSKYPSAMGFFKRGGLYNEQNKKQEAIVDYTSALTLVPDLYDAWVSRGAALRDAGRVNEAIQDLNKAISLRADPGWEAYMNRAAAYCMKGRLDEARSDFDNALKRNGQSAELYTNLGNYWDMVHNIPRAMEYYAKAIAINPKFDEAYGNRGYVFYTLKEYDKALGDYNAALAINDHNANVYLNRSTLYVVRQDWEKAWDDLQKARQLGRNVQDSYINLVKTNLDAAKK